MVAKVMNLAGQGHTGTEVRILMSVGLLGFHVSETSRRGRGDNEGGRGGGYESQHKSGSWSETGGC